MMSDESQRVVVIHHASSDLSTKALKWAINGFSLDHGDTLTLVAILRHVNSPTSARFRAIFGTDQNIIEEEVAKKKEKLHNHPSIRKISEQCEKHKIRFLIEVLPGKLPEHAISAAVRLKATSVILDRDMKKYKKDFMESLSCALLIMKSGNSIKHLRGPRQTKFSYTGYDNSVPEFSPSLWSMTNAVFRSRSSSDLTKIGCHQLHCQTKQTPEDKDLDMARGYCLLPIPDNQKTSSVLEMYPKETEFEHIRNHKTYQIVEKFKNSVCKVCENKRPKFELMKEFTYVELHEATHGFSPKNYLSEGGFGSVYWGKMQGLKIAVKKHKFASLQGEKEFKSEVNALSKAIHENVVMLLGSCSEGNNRFLVYEFVCNGSLDQHLSEHSRKPLTWPDRIKVAIGAAKGLLYLHENNIIHRDVRPSNILVTHDYEAMLGDFGLARTEQMDSVYSTDVVGTLGYMAPEYAESGKVSTKSDVYSFGVVLLQLITGMRTTDKKIGHKSLVGWARPLLKERNYPDLIDERMMDTYDCHQLFWMIRLAEKCLTRDPHKRLPMDTVVSALTHIVEGSTCSMVLRDCSPARSDSSYDMSESPMSDVSPESEDEEDGIVCVGCTTVNLRPPPSPPLGSTSWSSTSSTCVHMAE
ncbi:probable serine/threonine-protein kinase PBL26 [Vicia villosa]|uniref:probable serine/threonine-protein kinase PBL26 n=1 Tax=Vicia villosa TaxID=3911 RepID=UPI00273BDAE3|nr:probable serine/threonine-protein kinase PBL26 [Vicia villosa]